MPGVGLQGGDDPLHPVVSLTGGVHHPHAGRALHQYVGLYGPAHQGHAGGGVPLVQPAVGAGGGAVQAGLGAPLVDTPPPWQGNTALTSSTHLYKASLTSLAGDPEAEPFLSLAEPWDSLQMLQLCPLLLILKPRPEAERLAIH